MSSVTHTEPALSDRQAGALGWLLGLANYGDVVRVRTVGAQHAVPACTLRRKQ